MARSRTASRPVPLSGVPDGLAAHPVEMVRLGEGGVETVVRTRRGRAKLERVELRAVAPPAREFAIDPDVEHFVFGAQRRTWAVIEGRFGLDAWERSVELAQAGVVAIRCDVTDATRLGVPTDWRLTDDWDRRRAARRSRRIETRDDWDARGASAADAARAQHPDLAAALDCAIPGTAAHAVLVHAAEDLVADVVHAGPRAFSQVHFGDTKARDDLVDILRGAGVPERDIVSLGLRRSSRIGLAGPIRAVTARAAVDLHDLDGPVLIRADQGGLRLEWVEPAPLLVVENLQAAEALADRLPKIGMVYTAGLLGSAALELIGQLARHSLGAAVIPDADPGGVRIAEQVVRAVPGALVVDVGEFPHPSRDRWVADGIAVRNLQRAADGPAGDLARSCLDRGYPVEQEASIINASLHVLERVRTAASR